MDGIDRIVCQVQRLLGMRVAIRDMRPVGGRIWGRGTVPTGGGGRVSVRGSDGGGDGYGVVEG